MDQAAEFWPLMDSARLEAGGNLARQTELLERQLAELSPAQIEAFQHLLDVEMDKANTWEVWAAAYIINGGASDDGFDYFRGWLVMQGEEVFNAVLANIESLATYEGARFEEAEWEDVLYLPARVFEQKTGRHLGISQLSSETRGDAWDEDELAEKYPRLWAAHESA
ncbi:DUF4240 domain-containing protein [Deinococcus sp. AJ005]|uniref:DUF4240 domain-containing protein n=1 Tax=Deinococcus sp. AJ005 TaxID=2652443 RepID=UPI001865822A|nr:DUF4240 domain-containing protein [Deinococcus sp. AJ005]